MNYTAEGHRERYRPVPLFMEGYRDTSLDKGTGFREGYRGYNPVRGGGGGGGGVQGGVVAYKIVQACTIWGATNCIDT